MADEHEIELWLTADEHARLQMVADSLGLSEGEVLSQAIEVMWQALVVEAQAEEAAAGLTAGVTLS